MTPSTMSRTATTSCRPSTRRVAVPAAKLVTRAIIFCTRAVKVTISIRNMGMYRVQPVRPVVFQEYGQGDQHQSGQKLVGGAEQRPYVVIAAKGQQVTEKTG